MTSDSIAPIPFTFLPSSSDAFTSSSTFTPSNSHGVIVNSTGSPRSLPPGASYSPSNSPKNTMMTMNDNLTRDSELGVRRKEETKEEINSYWGSPILQSKTLEGKEGITELKSPEGDSLLVEPSSPTPSRSARLSLPIPPIPSVSLNSPISSISNKLPSPQQSQQPELPPIFTTAPSSTLPPSFSNPSTSIIPISNALEDIIIPITSILSPSPPSETITTPLSTVLPISNSPSFSPPSTSNQLPSPTVVSPTLSSIHLRQPSVDLLPLSSSTSSSRIRPISPSSAPPTISTTSNLPSFSPAPAFSAQDRGPYPPHLSPKRSSATSPSVGLSGGGYFEDGIGIGMGGMGGIEGGFFPMLNAPGSSPGSNLRTSLQKGKGREIGGVSGGDLFDPLPTPRRGSQFFSDSLPRGEVDRPISSEVGQAQDLTNVSGIAGVGRNSLNIRNSGIFGSPSSGGGVGGGGNNRFMGPASNVITNGRDSPQLQSFSQALPSSQILALSQSQTQVPQQQQQQQQKQQLQQSQPSDRRPPHLVPQPEICVECMVRDRDMIDVDVTGEGVWERDSDFDWEEALRWEELEGSIGMTGGAGGSVEKASEESFVVLPTTTTAAAASNSSQMGKRRTSGGAGSRESMAGSSSHNYGRSTTTGIRKRIGKGHPLSEANLKLWTSMNIPASAHRWKTLQTFLAMQIHLIEHERSARDQIAIERERLGKSDLRQFPNSPQYESTRTLGPDVVGVEGDKIKSRGRNSDGTKRGSIASSFFTQSKNQSRQASPVPSQQSYAYGDQPWLSKQARRFSSPQLKNLPPPSPSSLKSPRGFGFSSFGRSSIDLRSSNNSPRSPSPGRTGSNRDDRRGSLWSKFRSQSVLSFAPSGSMMDMHLGLSMDKHAAYNQFQTYPSMSDPAMVQQHSERERYRSNSEGQQALAPKLKKKGIKGFFNKLMTSNEGKKKEDQARFDSTASRMAGAYDNTDLMPPPPLSALANEPRYHQRTSSSSSLDSINRRYSQSPTSRHPYHSSSPVKPIGSSVYSPRTSSPDTLDTYPFDPSTSPVKKEKSLPSIPPAEAPLTNHSSPPIFSTSPSTMNNPYASSPTQSQFFISSDNYNDQRNNNNNTWNNQRQSQQSLNHYQQQQNLPPPHTNSLRGSQSFSSDLRNSTNLNRGSQSWINKDSREIVGRGVGGGGGGNPSEEVEEIEFDNGEGGRKNKVRSRVWSNFGLGKKKGGKGGGGGEGGVGRKGVDEGRTRVSEESVARVSVRI